LQIFSLAGKGAWLRVIMREGRKRQIRGVGTRLGLPVVKIIRIRIGTLMLGNLKPREWRHLTPQEVAGLRNYPGKIRPKPERTNPRPKRSGKSNHPRRVPEKDKHQ
jgi:23S rRNA pseudouridine2605 synthase